jgi:hypothetical protein
MRFNPEITQPSSVAKQFRQKNEKPALKNGEMDCWIIGLMNWSNAAGIASIYPTIQ